MISVVMMSDFVSPVIRTVLNAGFKRIQFFLSPFSASRDKESSKTFPHKPGFTGETLHAAG